jgi:hypothetical protein
MKNKQKEWHPAAKPLTVIVIFCLPTHNLLNICSWSKAEEKDDICEPRGGGQDHTQKPGGQGPGGGQGCTQELGGGQGRTQEPGGGQRLTRQREQEPPFRGRLLRVAGVPYVGKPNRQIPLSN